MASLQEVARRAKVSIATVSRVLNKSKKVVPETRAIVEQALRDLEYRPSRVARRLRMKDGRAHLVGLIIPDIQNPFYAEIARGVETQLTRQSMRCFFATPMKVPRRNSSISM